VHEMKPRRADGDWLCVYVHVSILEYRDGFL
jgi:hypothetical protein